MIIIVYLAVLFPAVYWVVKTLGPEMAKPPAAKAPVQARTFDIPQYTETDSRVNKLESLLAEKNKNISLLQTELQIFYVQVRDFEKLKSLLEDEIHRLKEQNRIFRSELGLPATTVGKEASNRLFI